MSIESHHQTLIEVLARYDVNFVLVGGVALQLHGYSGVTKDVDVTIAVDAANGERVEAALAALNAHPYLPGARGSSYHTAFGRLEVMRSTSGPGDYDGWMKNAVQIEVAPGVQVWVGDASDLLHSKEVAARKKDLDTLPRIRTELLASGRLKAEDIRGPMIEEPVQADRDPRLEELLGARPTDPRRQALWDRAAGMIADYRERWNLADTDDLLGPPPPVGTRQAADLISLDVQIERLQRLLGTRDPVGNEVDPAEGRER